jgi:hypothetical protein
MTHWTPAEDAVLRGLHAAGVKYAAMRRHLGWRAATTIQSRAHRLGLFRGEVGWTASRVRSMHARGFTDESIARRLGVTRNAVRLARMRMGLAAHPGRRRACRLRRWTADEVAALERGQRRLRKRTAAAVRRKRSRLGLAPAIRPRGETARLVRRLNARGWNDRAIADELGVGYGWVAFLRKREGLPRRARAKRRAA